jgi:hypothetical protein
MAAYGRRILLEILIAGILSGTRLSFSVRAVLFATTSNASSRRFNGCGASTFNIFRTARIATVLSAG